MASSVINQDYSFYKVDNYIERTMLGHTLLLKVNLPIPEEIYFPFYCIRCGKPIDKLSKSTPIYFNRSFFQIFLIILFSSLIALSALLITKDTIRTLNYLMLAIFCGILLSLIFFRVFFNNKKMVFYYGICEKEYRKRTLITILYKAMIAILLILLGLLFMLLMEVILIFGGDIGKLFVSIYFMLFSVILLIVFTIGNEIVFYKYNVNNQQAKIWIRMHVGNDFLNKLPFNKELI